jgi:hypothetical protein
MRGGLRHKWYFFCVRKVVSTVGCRLDQCTLVWK